MSAQRRPLPEPGLCAALALAAVYCLVFAAVSIMRYANFHGGNDIVDYAQMLWNTAHGDLLQKTATYGLDTGLRGGHSEPLLLLLAIPYRLFPDPRTMLVLQTLALSAGGPLSYCLARAHGHAQATALALATFYLLFPSIHYANIHEWHPDPFAVASLLGAFLAFERRRLRLLAACVALTLVAKEQMVLFVLGQGGYWWLVRRERRLGQAVIGAGLLYGLAVLLPWYLLTRGQYDQDYAGFFGQVQRALQGSGGLPGKASALLSILGQPERQQNLLLSLLPTAFLFLGDASALIALLPLLGLFLSNRPTNDVWFHHYATSVPVYLHATSLVLRRPALARRAAGLATLLACWAALLGYIYAGSTSSMMYWVRHPQVFQREAHARAQDAFIAGIPGGVALDASPVLGAHLANRHVLFGLQRPQQALRATYVLLDLYPAYRYTPFPQLALAPSAPDQATRAYLLRAGGFRLLRVDKRYGLYLYANCRGYPRAEGCRRAP